MLYQLTGVSGHSFLQKKKLKKYTTEIEYRYSEAPINLISVLGPTLSEAVKSSRQWAWERSIGGAATDCFSALAPKMRGQDISVNLLVGFEKGTQMIEETQLVPR